MNLEVVWLSLFRISPKVAVEVSARAAITGRMDAS